MKSFLFIAVYMLGIVQVQALVINEVVSNPTGDDSGREWIELYNDGSEAVDLSTLSVSIKGGNAITAALLQGSAVLAPGEYAIIGSVVSGATKFLQDYSTYTGALFKASISLVNTGVTSIDILLNGSTVSSLPSYTPAKEATSLSFIGGSYVAGNPTPGAVNQISEPETSQTTTSTSTTTTSTQATVSQSSPPLSDIVIYLPEEKVVVAGAETEFSAFSLTRAGKPIPDLRYTWAFGDGGQSTGSSTKYRFTYPGRYIVHVEANSASIAGDARMIVRVVAPDIHISSVGSGKYGSYIDIRNPNDYELDLSQWMFLINGASFTFPKNTTILPKMTTRFSGAAMGFASTTFTPGTAVTVTFPNLEEVTKYAWQEEKKDIHIAATVATSTFAYKVPVAKVASKSVQKVSKSIAVAKPAIVLGVATTSAMQIATTSSQFTATTTKVASTRDTRIISWIKRIFD